MGNNTKKTIFRARSWGIHNLKGEIWTYVYWRPVLETHRWFFLNKKWHVCWEPNWRTIRRAINLPSVHLGLKRESRMGRVFSFNLPLCLFIQHALSSCFMPCSLPCSLQGSRFQGVSSLVKKLGKDSKENTNGFPFRCPKTVIST